MTPNNDKGRASGLRVGPTFVTNTVIPPFPPLPKEVVERFPQLVAWQLAVAKWGDELTLALKNSR